MFDNTSLSDWGAIKIYLDEKLYLDEENATMEDHGESGGLA